MSAWEDARAVGVEALAEVYSRTGRHGQPAMHTGAAAALLVVEAADLQGQFLTHGTHALSPDPTRLDEAPSSERIRLIRIQPVRARQYISAMAGIGPWTDGRLRAAWARADWAAILREYRRATGLTQVQVETLTGIPQPHISAIESGRRQVKTVGVRARITEGLRVPQELIDAGQSPVFADWEPTTELRSRIAHGTSTGRVDLRTADWIGAVLATQRRAEDEVGGEVLWPVVRSQLDAVARLLPSTYGDAADRLLLLCAEHAHWLSWVAWQAGQRGPALGWLDMGYGWATDGAHHDMASWLTRVRAWYARQHGDPRRALRTAEAARLVPGVTPGAAAVAGHEAARAAAAVGDRDTARRFADSAYDDACRVPDEEDRPAWLYWLTPERAQLQRADTAYACQQWRDAADGIREALPALAAYPRDQEYYRGVLREAERRA